LRWRIEGCFHVKGSLRERRTAGNRPLYDVKFGKLAMKIILRACYYPGSVALRRKGELALDCLRSVNKRRWYRDVIPRLE
jgi:hypothetical protein